MGMYMYITDGDRKRFRVIKSDPELKELFEEALKYDNSLLISEHSWTEKKWFRKSAVKNRYQIYHDCSPGYSPYQAKYQMSASGDRKIIEAYLYGIINGALRAEENKNK